MGCHVPRLGVSPLQGERGEFDSHTVHKKTSRDVGESGHPASFGTKRISQVRILPSRQSHMIYSNHTFTIFCDIY